MFCIPCAAVVLPLIHTMLSMQVYNNGHITTRCGCLPFACVQVFTVATPLLAVVEAWAGVCTHGYNYNWSEYFDYAKAKALAKVRPLVLVALLFR
jgi:hypothetical protein